MSNASDYARGLAKGSLIAYEFIKKTIDEDGDAFASRLLIKLIEKEKEIIKEMTDEK